MHGKMAVIGVDIASIFLLVGSLVQALPPIAAGFTIVWMIAQTILVTMQILDRIKKRRAGQ